MLSGVGPKAELEKHGIQQLFNIPGVGQNLQDHVDVLIRAKTNVPTPFTASLGNLPNTIKSNIEYSKNKTGLLTTNFADCGGFIKVDKGEKDPDA